MASATDANYNRWQRAAVGGAVPDSPSGCPPILLRFWPDLSEHNPMASRVLNCWTCFAFLEILSLVGGSYQASQRVMAQSPDPTPPAPRRLVISETAPPTPSPVANSVDALIPVPSDQMPPAGMEQGPVMVPLPDTFRHHDILVSPRFRQSRSARTAVLAWMLRRMFFSILRL